MYGPIQQSMGKAIIKTRPKLKLIKYIKNTASGMCPACGEVILFLNWFKMKEKCDTCDTYFIEKNGDNWFFLVFIDRAFFIFPIVIMLYFSFSKVYFIICSFIIILIFIFTTPLRLGISLTFDYYMRTKIAKE